MADRSIASPGVVLLVIAIVAVLVALAFQAVVPGAPPEVAGPAGSAADVDGTERVPVQRDTAESTSAARREAASPTEEPRTPGPRLVVEVASGSSPSHERPLLGALVRAEGFDLPLGTTDGAGRLEVDLPPDTEGVRLSVEADGHTSGATTAYVRHGLAAATLLLSPVGELVGRVRHADGSPAADARVFAFDATEVSDLESPAPPPRLGPATPSATTDEQGRYRLAVAGGVWRLAAKATHGEAPPWGWADVGATLEGTVTRVSDLTLPAVPSERVLSGRVFDAAHAPVAGASVGFELSGAVGRVSVGVFEADGEGRFELVARAGDRFTLSASTSLPGLGRARAEGVAGGPEVELVLPAAPILEVAISLPGGRSPSHEFRWRLGVVGSGGDEWRVHGTCPAAEEGVFTTTFAEGASVLEVLAGAGFLAERVELPRQPGENARVEVELREGYRFEGRVHGAARGLPAPIVRARPAPDGNVPDDPEAWRKRGVVATRAAEDGSFRLGLPRPGTYVLQITGELREPLVVGPFQVLEPPGVVDLELRLVPVQEE